MYEYLANLTDWDYVKWFQSFPMAQRIPDDCVDLVCERNKQCRGKGFNLYSKKK
jgi:hypothetical protein